VANILPLSANEITPRKISLCTTSPLLEIYQRTVFDRDVGCLVEVRKAANYYAVVEIRGGGESTSRERRKWFAPAVSSSESVRSGFGNEVPLGMTKAGAARITWSALWQQLMVQALIPPA
jgi:hypothetical protein